MAMVILPPITPVPSGATRAERIQMYEKYKAELIAFNPGFFPAKIRMKDGKEETSSR
jgi:hypothetical protein